MPDYGHDLRFAANIVPSSDDPEQVVATTQLAERVGLDLVTFQDHPYQPALLDTWTLLSYVAARTSTIRLAPNVVPVPLRQPAVLARSAASLDLLSGGRVELGLGAGGYWDAIEAMGAPRLSPRQAVDALTEAVQVIRATWDTDAPGGVHVDGQHHPVHGAKRGPRPAHDVGIWLGAYRPRMLRLTGQLADGWLPSLPRLRHLGELPEGNAVVDDAALAAGRRPTDVRRMLNLGEEQPADRLVELAVTHGVSVFVLLVTGPGQLERFAGEVAPAVREQVAAARGAAG